MAMRRVGAREANQQFSTLLAATERDGETIIITRRGKAVARLVPEPAETANEKSVAVAAMLERFSRPMGGEPISREDLYDRGTTKSQ
jgi:prevent-host-death family protein